MPKVNVVKACRKSPGTCQKCGKTIEVGQGYIWWQFYHSRAIVRCAECPRPKQSELTNSDKKSRLYAAQEVVQDAINAQVVDFSSIDEFDVSALSEALRSAAEEVRAVGEEYTESGDNIEQTFSNSPTADDCHTWGEECEAWADALEQAADEIDNIAPDEPDYPEEPAELTVEQEEDKSGEPIRQYLSDLDAYEQALSDYDDISAACESAAQEAIDKAQEALDSDQPSCM